MAEPARSRIPYSEYLRLLEPTQRKHEYAGGVAWAITGGAALHAQLQRRRRAAAPQRARHPYFA
jgi:hypothetical protein